MIEQLDFLEIVVDQKLRSKMRSKKYITEEIDSIKLSPESEFQQLKIMLCGKYKIF